MEIQVNTGSNIRGRESLSAHIADKVWHALGRFSAHLTRVEVHLTDEAGKKSSKSDKRCVMEARPSGHQPVAVTHEAATLEEAYWGAAIKLQNLLGSTFGRIEGRTRSDSKAEGETGS